MATPTTSDNDGLLVALEAELVQRHGLTFPPAGKFPLAEGVIRLSSTLPPTPTDKNQSTTDTAAEAACLAKLNKTCFGQCMQSLRINQLGPILNISSVVVPTPISPYYPVRSDIKQPCECPRGLGVYLAANASALWTFPGTTPPRTFNVTIGSNGMLVVRHLESIGERFNCPYTFEVASGVVMGLRAKNDKDKKGGGGSIFPLWATVLIAIAGVLCLSGVAFIIIRRGAARQTELAGAGAGASSSSKKHHQHVRQSGGKSEKGKKVRMARGGGGSASLRDPLLELGDEEEGGYSTPGSSSTEEKR